MSIGAQRAGRAFVLPAENAPEAALVDDADGLCGAHSARGLRALRRPRAARALCRSRRRTCRGLRRHARRQRPGARQARARSRRGGRPQRAHGRPARHRQDDARLAPAGHPAADDAGGSARVGGDPVARQPGLQMSRWRQRPYRAPHHTASGVALVGGGSDPRPGEISMAMHGVLFLDELPEFDRRVLEVLREPLESGRVSISRAARQAEFPAQFQLVAAMNPCPCGFLGHYSGRCRCTPDQIARYRARISGRCSIASTCRSKCRRCRPKSSRAGSGANRRPCARARDCSAGTAAAAPGQTQQPACAARDRPPLARRIRAARSCSKAIGRLGLSARGYHRVLKVAHDRRSRAYRRSDPVTGDRAGPRRSCCKATCWSSLKQINHDWLH